MSCCISSNPPPPARICNGFKIKWGKEKKHSISSHETDKNEKVEKWEYDYKKRQMETKRDIREKHSYML